MTWNEVLKQYNLVGCDIEVHEGSDVYRGPIKSISRDGRWIMIDLDWVATRLEDWHRSSWKWRVSSRSRHLSLEMSRLGDPQLEEGRICSCFSMTEPIIIFPWGDSKLDPSEVAGLVRR